MDASHDELLAQFTNVTGASSATARAALQNTEWKLDEAVSLFYAAAEEGEDDDDENGDDEPNTNSARPRNPASSSSRSAAPPPLDTIPPAHRPPGTRPKQMTLDDLKKMHGDGDDEDDDDDKPQDLFAGGEKSALAVQNPDAVPTGPADHFRNILARARQDSSKPPAEGSAGPATRPSAFTGTAQTLGGDDAPSRIIADPRGQQQQQRSHPQEPRVNRTLHLWADGVSVDDGPLFRFDDPANADMMVQIRQGLAPLSLLDVQPGEELNLNMEPHKDENYRPVPKVYKAFGGQGQRLGSPTPGVASTTSTNTATPAPAAAPPPTSSAGTQSVVAAVPLDESQPILRLQIRLTDGTRLAARFNSSNTVGEVYDYVRHTGGSENGTRDWVLMTTFPSKELTDESTVLGAMEELGRGGGVVVQKWR